MLLGLGARTHDLARRALVMGVVDLTPGPAAGRDGRQELESLCRRAGEMVAAGADLLDVGGLGSGADPGPSEPEELERVVPVISALAERFEVALSVGTRRASVAAESFRAGAVVGNDASGFADPGYLAAAAGAGATVVVAHGRLAPRPGAPGPDCGQVVEQVRSSLAEGVERARAAGVGADRIVVDAGIDQGKTTPCSLALLAGCSRLADLGVPLLLSVSGNGFLAEALGLEPGQMRQASSAAHAVGLSLGARVLRAFDVAAARRVRDTLAAVMAAE
ncbi:MAG: dihydropteroate synthase [Actinomycetota bacterium]|nr:dihydropteroate synthase [Actinomycetota bacterium]